MQDRKSLHCSFEAKSIHPTGLLARLHLPLQPGDSLLLLRAEAYRLVTKRILVAETDNLNEHTPILAEPANLPYLESVQKAASIAGSLG